MLVIRYMTDDLIEIQTPAGPILIRCNPQGRGRRVGIDAPKDWRITINGERAIDVLRRRDGRDVVIGAGAVKRDIMNEREGGRGDVREGVRGGRGSEGT